MSIDVSSLPNNPASGAAGHVTAHGLIHQKLKEDLRLVLDVRDFGADPTGVADATAAFNAAIAEAVALGGGIVGVPRGQFLLDGPVALAHKVGIRGLGKYVSVMRMSATGYLQFSTPTESGVRFPSCGDFSIDGNFVSDYPLRVGRTAQFTLANVRSIKAVQSCLLVEATQNTLFSDIELVRGGTGTGPQYALRINKGAKNITFLRPYAADSVNANVLIGSDPQHPVESGVKNPESIDFISGLIEECPGVLEAWAGEFIRFLAMRCNGSSNVRAVFMLRATEGCDTSLYLGDHTRVQASGGPDDTIVDASHLDQGGVERTGSKVAFHHYGGTSFAGHDVWAKMGALVEVSTDGNSKGVGLATVARWQNQAGVEDKVAEQKQTQINGGWFIRRNANLANIVSQVAPAYTPDDTLVASLAAKSEYLVRGCIYVTGDPAADAQLAWDVPSGAAFDWIATKAPTALSGTPFTAETTVKTVETGSTTAGVLTTNQTAIRIEGTLATDVAGTFRPKYAQAVSSATALVIRAGSWLEIEKKRS